MSEFNGLVEREIPRLRRYARALTRSADRADDLVQETLLRAISKCHLWQTGTDIRAWLFTIMHNHYVNMVRRAMRTKPPSTSTRCRPRSSPSRTARIEPASRTRSSARPPAWGATRGDPARRA